MVIAPLSVDESGPGIDLSNQPEGIAIEMSDPVTDFEYARNAVTATFDLSGFETVRLAFAAMEPGRVRWHAPYVSVHASCFLGFGNAQWVCHE